ncbi:hypothetical protein ASG52_23715 [Methylobacterium sp. Leaf456]|uniref:hypothetical protein n=1 Tax=Methylobacterium sp. Leaf456 TaxID=1736382 RepID=UPI0006F8F298|nr:hypothetical protein [Methylobacterium sp. Leaf456]KQT57635.1 hypothetical protein ASG52_23715 [Methylobacterium sp. Leaf456]
MPTNHRDRTGRAPRRLRGFTAVVALYALVLQALLGGIAALPVAGAPGFLCVAPAEAAPEDKPAPTQLHAACCTAAGHAPSAAPPPVLARAPAWSAPDAAAPGWPGRPRLAARAPPFLIASARAPPLT